MTVKNFSIEFIDPWNLWSECLKIVSIGNENGIKNPRFKLVLGQIFHNYFPFIIFDWLNANDQMVEFDVFSQVEMVCVRNQVVEYS